MKSVRVKSNNLHISLSILIFPALGPNIKFLQSSFIITLPSTGTNIS